MRDRPVVAVALPTAAAAMLPGGIHGSGSTMSRRANAGGYDSFSLGGSSQGEGSFDTGSLNVGIGGYGEQVHVGASDSKYGRKFRPSQAADVLKRNAQAVCVAVVVVVVLFIVWRAQTLQHSHAWAEHDKILQAGFGKRFSAMKAQKEEEDKMMDPEHKMVRDTYKNLDKLALKSKAHSKLRAAMIKQGRERAHKETMKKGDAKLMQDKWKAKTDNHKAQNEEGHRRYLELEKAEREKKEAQKDRRRRNEKIRQIQENGSTATMTDAEEAAIKAAHERAMQKMRAQEAAGGDAAAAGAGGDAAASAAAAAAAGARQRDRDREAGRTLEQEAYAGGGVDMDALGALEDEREQRLREREAALLAREEAHRQMEAEREQDIQRRYLEELYAKQQMEMMRMQQEMQRGGGDAGGDEQGHPGHPNPADVVVEFEDGQGQMQ